MLADALRLQIEDYARGLRTRNPFYLRAAAGTLGREHMSRYLANVQGLIQETIVNLARARDVAASRGEEALSSHFATKVEEETGHDAWAERDVSRMTGRAAVTRPNVLPSMRRYIAFQKAVIEEDPSLYLAYCLFAEYLVVLLGPEWLRLLDERCGIPATSLSVVANHAELDRDHVQEALDDFDELVGDPSKLPRLRQVLSEAFAHFDAFCEDACTPETTTRDHFSPAPVPVHKQVA